MIEWEYCSLQMALETSQQVTLLGTINQVNYNAYYYIHRVHGMECQCIYEGDDKGKSWEAVSKYIAILGRYGWEAISIVQANNGEEWIFKRKIEPSNQYITF